MVTNVLTEEETESFLREVHRFHTDHTLPAIKKENEKDIRVDHWWLTVASKGGYPALCKMSLALLTCFHGAQVESSFSSMSEIIDKKSCNLRPNTYNAIQTVRYALIASGKTAVQYFRRKDVHHDAVRKDVNRNIQSSKRMYDAEKKHAQEATLEKAKQLQLNLQQLKMSNQQAKLAALKANKTARIAQKRAAQHQVSSQSKKAKH